MIKFNIDHRILKFKSKYIHTCDICGDRSLWNENWSWWGSYEDLEEGNKIYKVCSAKCKANFMRGCAK